MFKPEIFRAYDVRGIYGQDFDAVFAQRLGGAVASYLRGGPLVVGRDFRRASDDVAYAFIDGAVHSGARVIDVGQVSSPQLYWAIGELGGAGIMVTASHNPESYDGFKVIGRHGQIIDGGHIRQIYDGHPYHHHSGGGIDSEDIVPGYAAAVARSAGWSGQEIQMAIDPPEPVRRALELIAPIAPDHGLAARCDADGDRVAFYADGRPVAADWIVLLLAQRLLYDPIVLDLRFSRAVFEQLNALNIRHHLSAVGRPAVTKAMETSDAALGAEISGHFYFKEFGNRECPELVMLHIARIIQEGGKALSELIAPFLKYSKGEEIGIPIKDRKAGWSTIRKIQAHYQSCVSSRLDGLTIDCWADQGWWFNIRPSNTEPLLRLVVEAKEKDLLEEKVREIRQFSDPLGGMGS